MKEMQTQADIRSKAVFRNLKETAIHLIFLIILIIMANEQLKTSDNY